MSGCSTRAPAGSYSSRLLRPTPEEKKQWPAEKEKKIQGLCSQPAEKESGRLLAKKRKKERGKREEKSEADCLLAGLMKRGGGRLRVYGLARKVKAGSPSKKEKRKKGPVSRVESDRKREEKKGPAIQVNGRLPVAGLLKKKSNLYVRLL